MSTKNNRDNGSLFEYGKKSQVDRAGSLALGLSLVSLAILCFFIVDKFAYGYNFIVKAIDENITPINPTNPTFESAVLTSTIPLIMSSYESIGVLVTDATGKVSSSRIPYVDSIYSVNSSFTLGTGGLIHNVPSVSYPTYSFVGDTNTGIFSTGADILNVVVGGHSMIETGIGVIQIGNGLTDYSRIQLGTGTTWGYMFSSPTTLPHALNLSYNAYVNSSGSWVKEDASKGSMLLTVSDQKFEIFSGIEGSTEYPLTNRFYLETSIAGNGGGYMELGVDIGFSIYSPTRDIYPIDYTANAIVSDTNSRSVLTLQGRLEVENTINTWQNDTALLLLTGGEGFLTTDVGIGIYGYYKLFGIDLTTTLTPTSAATTYGLYIGNTIGGTSTTNYYGIYITSPAGTVTNDKVGIYISAPTDAPNNNYSLSARGLSLIDEIWNYDLLVFASGSAEIRSPFSLTSLAAGTLSVDGAGLVTSSSDVRLKTNINYFESSSLEKILQLKPCIYRFKTDSQTIYEGFIAQDVETVIPYAVDGKKHEYYPKLDEKDKPILDENGNMIDDLERPRYRGLNTTSILAHSVKAIQELYKMIEQLQSQNKILLENIKM